MKYEMENLLFRYRNEDENSINAFEDNKLYFSIPDYFNDPFDSVAYINQKNLKSRIEKDLDEHMLEYLNNATNQLFSLVTSFNRGKLYELSKDEDIRNDFFRMVTDLTVCLKHKITQNCKIICFSEKYLSNLMWAHYSNYHKGFVLGYTQDDIRNASIFDENNLLIEKKIKLKKIKYSEFMVDTYNFAYKVLPMFGKIESDSASLLIKMLTTKMQEWGYEHEWRLCSWPDNIYNMDLAHYINIVPRCILLGVRMDKLERERIIKIAKKKKIDIFDVECDSSEDQYKLKINNIFSYYK